MSEHEAVSLAGQFATLQSQDGTTEPVVFGPDVMHTWEKTGRRTNSNEPQVLYPVIRGNLKTDKDFSKFAHGKLIIADGTTFNISFNGPTYFTASEPWGSPRNILL